MPDKSRYFYHGTTEENLDSIARQGLVTRPSLAPASFPEASDKYGIFVTEEEWEAQFWADSRSDALKGRGYDVNPVVLRFPKSVLPECAVVEPDELVRGAKCISKSVIPSDAIEMRNGSGDWVHVRSHQRRR